MSSPKISLRTVISLLFQLLFFATPLFFLPYNFELFEFNKMLLVYGLTVLIAAVWLGRMVLNRQFLFRHTLLDRPLLLFLLSQIVSTVFSIDPYTSVFGYYTRAHGGLLSTISYLLLYWAFVSNLDRKQTLKVVRALLLGGTLVAGYGVAEHFGIDQNYWVQDVKNRVFSTLGQPNWLAAYLAAILFLPFSLKNLPTTKKLARTVFFWLPPLFYLCLLYTKSRSGLLAFLMVLPLFILIHSRQAKKWPLKKFKAFIPFLAIVFLFTLFTVNPVSDKLAEKIIGQTKAPLPAGILISESGDIRKIVWQGAVDIFKNHPLVGSGVETFAYSYYQFRPQAHNLVSEWDFLYNKAHNEYLNFLATTGLIGLFAYFLVIFSSFRQLLSKPRSSLDYALAGGYLTILVTNFFGFSVVVIGLFFFLFPAFAFTLRQKPHPEPLPVPLNQTSKILLVTLVLVTLLLCRQVILFWRADYFYNQTDRSLEQNNPTAAYRQIQTALTLRQDPNYFDRLGLAAATLSWENFQAKETTAAAQLAETAVAASDQALKISPFHLNFWKNRARLFLQLAQINPQFRQEALTALEQAAKLAPTDAKVHYNLALIYQQDDQIGKALQLLQKTILLKPNYKDARFALAFFLQQKGDSSAAVAQLRYILEKIDPTDENIKKLLEEWQNQ